MDLHDAAARGKLDVVRRLLAEGADVNESGKGRSTPLHRAARSGQVESASLLLDAGADVEATDGKGWTPLQWAAYGGHSAVVQLLLEQGANADVRARNGLTPLYWAARRGDPAAVDVLLQRDVDVNVQDECGWSGLDWATYVGHRETEAALRRAGARDGGHMPPPELQGAPDQVSEALAIRADVLSKVAEIQQRAQMAGRAERQMILEAIEGVRRRVSAGWWIEDGHVVVDYIKDVCLKASMARTIREVKGDGGDLVKVSTHNGACPRCAPWQGKILSISGKDSGYPSLDQAKAAGLFHPNCAHCLLPYTGRYAEARARAME